MSRYQSRNSEDKQLCLQITTEAPWLYNKARPWIIMPESEVQDQMVAKDEGKEKQIIEDQCFYQCMQKNGV